MRAPQFENSPFLFLIHTQISSMTQFANGLLILARPNWPVSYNFYFFKWTQIESKYHQFTSNQHNNPLRLGSGNTDRPFPANRGLTGVNMSFKKSADKKTNPELQRTETRQMTYHNPKSNKSRAPSSIHWSKGSFVVSDQNQAHFGYKPESMNQRNLFPITFSQNKIPSYHL